jgi:fluoride exporter
MGALLVFVGGGLGAVLRQGVNRMAFHLIGPGLPWGTLIVNVLGSLAMGLLIGALAAVPGGTSHHLRQFLATGILGGFTTFSAFSLDALTLWERGQYAIALAYVAATLCLSLAAVAAGFLVSRHL